MELTGAVTSNFQLSKGQLQALAGGNYAIRKNLTLDFGLVAGRFAASPGQARNRYIARFLTVG